MTHDLSNDHGRARFPNETLHDVACPGCGRQGVDSFYAVDDIPIHDMMLMGSVEEARTCPTRDLELAVCPRCGFIFNAVYDPSVHDYVGEYEETQGFSSTFNQFARSLAQHVVDDYGLRNKTVLEIGCGKGEFLALLCELGGNRGIGIDPTHVKERGPNGTVRAEFIREFFDERYLYLEADLICCRHTLEHIAPTAEFMRLVCTAAANRPNTTLFFEIPDVLRILREGAFWDIFYDHCSYFTPGSVARLFRSVGVNLSELRLDFDDQYILVAGQLGDAESDGHLPLEADLDEIPQAVAAFRQNCAAALEKWQRYVRNANEAGGRVVIWGAASKGVAFLTSLGMTEAIRYAVDINPFKHGKFLPSTGQETVSPDFLADYQPTHVIVMNPIYCDEIGQMLRDRGVNAEVVAA